MKILYIAWRCQEDKSWTTVGCLKKCVHGYTFFYTKGAERARNFFPFGRMDDFRKIYKSEELFPFIQNRLLNESRSEFKDYLRWLNFSKNTYDPLEALALTEGRRGTDSIEIFPCPQKNKHYMITFFCHGINHMSEATKNVLLQIKTGDTLYLMKDCMNRYDKNAIALRTDDPATLVGYCPRYLTNDLYKILESEEPELISCKVSLFNSDAPMQLKLLCTLKAHWPDNFAPCSGSDFLPIPKADDKCVTCENFE